MIAVATGSLGSILRDSRVQVPRPGQNPAVQVVDRNKSAGGEEISHLEAAAAGAADHHGFLRGVQLAQPVRDLTHGYVQVIGGHRSQRRLPAFANVEKGEPGATGAPFHEFPRGHLLDHQNTNFCAATALIRGSTTVSNKLSRIHSLPSTRRIRTASITGATPTMTNKRPPTRRLRSKRVS